MAMHHGSLNCKNQQPVSDPNVLDGYEEGTWTPQVFGSSTSGTTTYDFRSGTYTKIGRLVFFTFNAAWTSATGTGGIQISGLPFPASLATVGISLYLNGVAYTAGAHPQGFVAPGASLFIKQVSAGGAAVDLPISSTGQIAGSGFYQI